MSRLPLQWLGRASRGSRSMRVWISLALLVTTATCRVRREGEPASIETDPAISASAASLPRPEPTPSAVAKATASAVPSSKPPTATDTSPPRSDAGSDEPAVDASARPELPSNSAVVAHGGAGTAPTESDVVLHAVHRTLTELGRGASAADAAVRGVMVLEDAPAFDAGTGSSLRLDGTVQMDAAVADSKGRYGAVFGIERVKNPILTALALSDSATPVLVGEGAAAFARGQGQKSHAVTTAAATAERLQVLQALGYSPDAGLPDWAALQRLMHRSEQGPADGGTAATKAARLTDGRGSVAVLVRGRGNVFAGAVSDGGSSVTLRGRAGALALHGAALYVGANGAVAISGEAASIVRSDLARAIYDHMKMIGSAKAAIVWGLGQVEAGDRIGISALNKISVHSAATVPMAWAEWARGGFRTGALEQP